MFGKLNMNHIKAAANMRFFKFEGRLLQSHQVANGFNLARLLHKAPPQFLKCTFRSRLTFSDPQEAAAASLQTCPPSFCSDVVPPGHDC